MTIRALIAEDEAILATTLAAALGRLWPELELVAMCANGVDALQEALHLRPDIMFLDIKMPGKTGLEAAEELANAWDSAAPFPQIVFVTAYDNYALDAFEQAAADYVLKPVNDARLASTVKRLRARLASRHGDDNLAPLLEQMRALLPPAPALERLSVIRAGVGNQVRMIPVQEVVFFEATDKYVNVVTRDGEALIRVSLKELLAQLDARVFWQIHRGTIVNVNAVASSMRDDMGKVSLNLRERAEKLRVSPLYAHLFRQM